MKILFPFILILLVLFFVTYVILHIISEHFNIPEVDNILLKLDDFFETKIVPIFLVLIMLALGFMAIILVLSLPQGALLCRAGTAHRREAEGEPRRKAGKICLPSP